MVATQRARSERQSGHDYTPVNCKYNTINPINEPKLQYWIYAINPIEDDSRCAPGIPINQREINNYWKKPPEL